MPDINNEQRNYYRITDHAVLEYKIMAQHKKVDDLRALFNMPARFQLLNDIQAIERESRQLLQTIGTQNKSMANYLQTLEKRLELLVRYIALDDPQMAEKPSHEINLSEGGISFHSADPLKKGERIALKLLIPSHTLCIICKAQVTNCEAESLNTSTACTPNRYIIGLAFQNLCEQDRKQLARYIMRKQAFDKKQQME